MSKFFTCKSNENPRWCLQLPTWSKNDMQSHVKTFKPSVCLCNKCFYLFSSHSHNCPNLLQIFPNHSWFLPRSFPHFLDHSQFCPLSLEFSRCLPWFSHCFLIFSPKFSQIIPNFASQCCLRPSKFLSPWFPSLFTGFSQIVL